MRHELPVCVGFDVVEPFIAPGGVERFRCLSRRYHVRDAAEQFCQLVKSQGIHPKAYVREVLGNAEAEPPKAKGRK